MISHGSSHSPDKMPGALTVRFPERRGNRTDKSPPMKPRRSRTHRPFQNRAQLRRRPFTSLPTRSGSLPVSERPFSASMRSSILIRSAEPDSDGFLKPESLDFWSGKGTALLPLPPLRTGHDGFLSSGSSHCKAPHERSRSHDGFIPASWRWMPIRLKNARSSK